MIGIGTHVFHRFFNYITVSNVAFYKVEFFFMLIVGYILKLLSVKVINNCDLETFVEQLVLKR